MRKLKLQVQMSVDGFVAGPDGAMDWMVWNWDDALNHYVSELTKEVDTILMGRKMVDGFIKSWSAIAADPAHPEHTSGRKFIEMPKVVFSRTLQESSWPNTTIASAELSEEIQRLKQLDGGDMIAYGGARFVSSLIATALVNDYYFFVNPVIMGKGMPIFTTLTQQQPLTLIESIAFDCQIVLLHYMYRST